MGRLGDLAKTIKARGKELAGKVVEKTGKALHLKGLERKGQELQDEAQQALREIATRGGKIASVDRDSVSVETAAEVSDVLGSFSSYLKGRCRAIEKEGKKEVSDYFDAIIDTLAEGLGENNGTVRSLRREKDLAVNSIDDSLINYLSKRVSVQDNECMKIMGMASGKEKEQAIGDFGARVIREGLDCLCDKLEQTMTKLQEDISEELDNLASTQGKQLDSFISQTREILERRLKDETDLESAMLRPAQGLAASEVALEVLESTKA